MGNIKYGLKTVAEQPYGQGGPSPVTHSYCPSAPFLGFVALKHSDSVSTYFTAPLQAILAPSDKIPLLYILWGAPTKTLAASDWIPFLCHWLKNAFHIAIKIFFHQWKIWRFEVEGQVGGYANYFLILPSALSIVYVCSTEIVPMSVHRGTV